MTSSWLYVAEILPAVWMGYGVASSWIFSIAIAVATPYCIDGIGKWTFFILLMFTAASAPFFWFFTSETKDKTIEEIRKQFETGGSKTAAVTEEELARRGDPGTQRELKEVVRFNVRRTFPRRRMK